MDNDIEIRKTLRDIIEYVGVDPKFIDNATLQTYLERLIAKSQSSNE